MEGAATSLSLGRSLALVCHRQRSSSGLSASSSSYFTSPNLKVSHFDFLDKVVARLRSPTTPSCKERRFRFKWQAFQIDSEVGLSSVGRVPKFARSRAGALRANVQYSVHCVEPKITTSAIQTWSSRDQCIRLVQTERTQEEEEEEASGISTRGRSSSGHARFAAISARTHRPPPLPPPKRSKVPKYVTAGIILSVAAFAIWQAQRSESYARDQLNFRDRSADTSPPQQVDEAFERAKASVAQSACVKRAVAAIHHNNFMECAIEMELALERNRLARTPIESDFYEEEEIQQVYQGVIKMWTDGYPLDYGKVLQLRNLLDLPSQKAEALEEEVLQQSDAYVI